MAVQGPHENGADTKTNDACGVVPVEEYSAFTRSEAETLRQADAVIDLLKQKDVLIYGAGTAGAYFFEVLAGLGIVPKCYLDRNAEKIQELMGLPVHDPALIGSLDYRDRVVIVAVNEVQTAARIIECLQQTESLIFNGVDLIRILRFPACTRKLADNEMLDILHCAKCGVDVKKCPLFTRFLQRESKFDAATAAGSKKFDWVGYILGQVCTLKCECCCEGIPFVKNAGFVKAADVISDLEKLVEACEYLERLEFIGGEPLLHPELARILKAALTMKKVGYLYVFTNGSVVPDDELCLVLKNPRLVVHISNYNDQWPENLPNNIAAVKEKFAQHGIKYIFLENSSWLDISRFDANGLDAAALEREFAKCFINHCHRLHNGILYRCPHQFAGIQLEELKPVQGQYIDLATVAPEELAEALDDFENLKFLDSCGHCSMPVGPRQVPVGKQVARTKTVRDEP